MVWISRSAHHIAAHDLLQVPVQHRCSSRPGLRGQSLQGQRRELRQTRSGEDLQRCWKDGVGRHLAFPPILCFQEKWWLVDLWTWPFGISSMMPWWPYWNALWHWRQLMCTWNYLAGSFFFWFKSASTRAVAALCTAGCVCIASKTPSKLVASCIVHVATARRRSWSRKATPRLLDGIRFQNRSEFRDGWTQKVIVIICGYYMLLHHILSLLEAVGIWKRLAATGADGYDDGWRSYLDARVPEVSGAWQCVVQPDHRKPGKPWP